ncbi:MAG: hypothetical protein LKI25_07970 [Atopobiaceae bacterium]|nr:hypothetical protein [Atopobiaceae bacterium]MCI2174122.1 hypothetical protein [Atopobiaceae bacterium]MCI2206763.1 hypothetical protein [Atopobiaceae bacterium]
MSDPSLRTRALIALSVLADALLVVYDIACVKLFGRSATWYVGQIVWTVTLACARVAILVMDRSSASRKARHMEVVTGVSLLCTALEVCLLSVFSRRFGVPLPGTSLFVLVDGLYVVIKLVLSFASKTGFGRDGSDATAARCRILLSRAEVLFLFSILFRRLIEVYGWLDGSLIPQVNLWQGLIAGIAAAVMGATLLLGPHRKREH